MINVDTVLNVKGMSCSSCVRHVTSALAAVTGVSRVDVQLKDATVNVRHEPDAPVPRMLEALRAAGYDAEVRLAGTNPLNDVRHREREATEIACHLEGSRSPG